LCCVEHKALDVLYEALLQVIQHLVAKDTTGIELVLYLSNGNHVKDIISYVNYYYR